MKYFHSFILIVIFLCYEFKILKTELFILPHISTSIDKLDKNKELYNIFKFVI